MLHTNMKGISPVFKPTAIAVVVGASLFCEAQGATINVGPMCSIVEAVNAANTNAIVNSCVAGDSAGTDTIVLPANTTFTYGAANFDLYAEPSAALPLISSDITISGNGSTIERDVLAADEFKVIYVAQTGALTANSLTIQNGVANGQRSQNKAGGGIYSRGGAINLTDVIVTNNTASRFGGGIASAGSLTIVDSVVSSNTLGGIELFTQGSFSLTGSSVSNNNSTAGPGIHGFAVMGHVIDDSEVNANLASGIGSGGISLSGLVTISNSTISNNSSSSRGGGLQVFDLFGNPGSLTLSNSTISGNSGDPVIYSRATAEITGTSMTMNNGNLLELKLATLLDGLVIEDNLNSGINGKVVYAKGPDLVFSNNIIRNNQGRGATLYSATITNSSINGNNDGGLVLLYGSANGLTISGNTGRQGMRAIYSSLENLTVTNNTSTLSGAGIYGSNFTLKNSTVTGNSSSASGGGIYVRYQNPDNDPTLIENVYVANNEAVGGGGLSANSTNLSIVDSEFISNQVTSSGGAIAVGNTDLSIVNTKILSNSANGPTAAGGGIFAGPSSTKIMTLQQSVIENNFAGNRGGGIFINSSSNDIVNSTFSENHATNSGGAIGAVGPGLTTIRNSTLTNNSASNGGGVAVDFSNPNLSFQSSIIANSVGGDCLYLPLDNKGNWFEDTSCNGLGQGPVMLGPPVLDNGLLVAFSLASNSGAIDAGGQCGVETDALGAQRSECKCDAGAFEVAEVKPDNSSCKGAFFVLPAKNGNTIIIEL